MPDRILIVDDIATHRIVLKVKLAAAAYDVVQADSLAEAAAAAVRLAPRLVILSVRAATTTAAEAFCRRLAAAPATADLPVMVIGPDPGQAARLGLLAAGVAEILLQPVDEAVLLARVRSLLRRIPRQADWIRTAGADFGFAAPVARFDPPGSIAIVSADRTQAMRWKRALQARVRGGIALLAPDSLFDALRDGPVPDAFLIAAGPQLGDLRLIAELKARPETQSAVVLVVGGSGEPEFAVMALDLGAGDVIADGFDAEELMLRLRARLRQKHAGDQRQRSVEEGLRLAVTDPLTGLANRRAAFARLSAIAAAAAAQNRAYALMILDIDRFKRVNDSHGHAAGDRVLAEVAGRLARNMRDGDLLARIGGEEFLVALPTTALVPARMAAERLRRVIEATPVALPSGAAVFVTLSIGLWLGTGGAETVDTAFDRADRALYAAKAQGRNMVTIGRSVA